MKNKLLCWLLGALGFSAMTSCDDMFSTSDEYGTPYAEFSVSGKVSDESGKPINGIRVVLTTPEDYYTETDTTYTSVDGEYLFDYPDAFTFRDPTLTIEAADVDGEENGQYKKKEIVFAVKPFEGRDGWYWGASHNTVDFVLTAGVDEEESEDGGDTDTEQQ